MAENYSYKLLYKYGINIFEKLDLRDKRAVQDFFKKYPDVSDVIHFAASKAVGESVGNPLLYYENNINTLIYLLQELQQKEDSHFIFSSSFIKIIMIYTINTKIL